MFNQEIKERYKIEKEKNTVMPKGAIDKDFEKIEPYEIKINKDVYDFTTYEIINMYKTINIKSVDTLYVLNSRLKQYVAWALSQNLVADNQNHFAEINREMILDCVNRIALDLRNVDRRQILSWCSRLPNANDKFCILGLFEGLNGSAYEDLWNTSIDDIDKINKTIRLRERVIPISDDLIEYAEESNVMTEFAPMSVKEAKVVPAVENGKIIKDKINTRFTDPLHKKKAVYMSVKRACIYLDINDWFNTSTLHEAGMIDFIRKRIKELNISFKDYLFSDYKTEVEKQFDRNIVRSTFYTKYKRYFEFE